MLNGKPKVRAWDFYYPRGTVGVAYVVPSGTSVNPTYEHFGSGEDKSPLTAYLKWWDQRIKRKRPTVVQEHIGQGCYRLTVSERAQK